MSSMEGMSSRALLDQLPPLGDAPVLERLAIVGLHRFRNEHAVDTPTLPDGTVDHDALVQNMRALVSPQYRWKAPFFDEHHLNWEADAYKPESNNGDVVPSRFRELATQKLYTPRQFHVFTHIMTHEPPVPERPVMRQHIDRFRRLRYMWRLANEAITLYERDQRAIPLVGQDRVIDPETRRVFVRERFERDRRQFIARLEQNFEQGLPPDLTDLSILQLVEEGAIEEILPTIRRQLGEATVYVRNGRRKSRSVALPIDRAA